MKTSLAVFVLMAALGTAQAADYGAPPPDIAARLDRLVRAYPDFIASHDAQWLLLKDGRRLAISDGRTDKSFDEMLERPDVDDMFYTGYPAGAPPAAPAANDDPGRVRYAPLFDAMYGDCKRGEVQPKLRSVAWLPKHHGGHLLFATANGADRALAAAIAELDELPDAMTHYLVPSSGTYNCRVVAGSRAPSAHGWGIAIDINADAAEYWRWSGGKWHNRIPFEIVRIFERHGFIWGGRWSHYDTMHFEYRPELLP
jgi:D-alanyl-D-alanine carboxypeptidase